MEQKLDTESTEQIEDILNFLQDATKSFPEENIVLRDLFGSLGQRSFGLAVLVFSVPMIFPMPPGVPMIAGLVIAILGVQILLGHPYLWLPNWLGQKTINRKALLKAYTFASRYFGWMFRLAKPRMLKLTGPKAFKISGGIFSLLGLSMVLPIPIVGNILPALSCTVLALGLTHRDGLIYLIGLMVTVITLGSMFFMSVGVVSVLKRIF